LKHQLYAAPSHTTLQPHSLPSKRHRNSTHLLSRTFSYGTIIEFKRRRWYHPSLISFHSRFPVSIYLRFWDGFAPGRLLLDTVMALWDTQLAWLKDWLYGV
jgi:hypothetical protein